MSQDPPHLLHTLSDDDWQLIIGGLRSLKNKSRAAELADQLLAWRLEVSKARARFWEAFRDSR